MIYFKLHIYMCVYIYEYTIKLYNVYIYVDVCTINDIYI